jgi:nifR3 family TIM-barrel protein
LITRGVRVSFNGMFDKLMTRLRDGSVPLYLAPQAGVSESPFRRLCRRFGADVVVSEFVSAEGLRRGSERTHEYLRFADEERPIGVQIFGADPQGMAEAAALVEQTYAPDFLDINFGCPVKKVLGRCRGGYHLSQPEVALEIVRRTRDVVPAAIPVSVKMRRGIDDSPEARDKFFTILDGAFAAGVAAVTVHGRTVEQRYIGPSKWDFLREVKQHVGQRVILGSGDLFSAEDCLAMIERTGVDGVTVARGAIGNPWIFSQARALADGWPLPAPPSLHVQREVIAEHFRLSEMLYGERRCGTVMRKFGIKYAALHPHYAEVRSGFVRVRGRDDWQAVLDRHYAEDLPGCHPARDLHAEQGEDCGEAA